MQIVDRTVKKLIDAQFEIENIEIIIGIITIIGMIIISLSTIGNVSISSNKTLNHIIFLLAIAVTILGWGWWLGYGLAYWEEKRFINHFVSWMDKNKFIKENKRGEFKRFLMNPQKNAKIDDYLTDKGIIVFRKAYADSLARCLAGVEFERAIELSMKKS